jgi:hypothetical protein
LISWPEYERSAATYCQQAGLDLDAGRSINKLRLQLTALAQTVDREFPDNQSLRIEGSEPVLSKVPAKQAPLQLTKLLTLIEERVEHISILDVFADTERWLNWTRFLGPLSGHDAKVANPESRYVITTFGYGCGLGPTQTARSIKVLDRRQIAWINQHRRPAGQNNH